MLVSWSLWGAGCGGVLETPGREVGSDASDTTDARVATADTSAGGDAAGPGADVAGAPTRIVWVGAHPDDEVMIAPLFAEACLQGGARCTILVATRGEASCSAYLPPKTSCGDARAAEMIDAAASLGAALVQWELPNGPSSASVSVVRSRWAEVAGSAADLVGKMRDTLDQLRPDVLYTYDPRHGTTCHAEHRVVSELVLQALGATQSISPLLRWHALHYQSTPGTPLPNPVVRDEAGTLEILDANRPIPGSDKTYWSFVPETMQIHRTQFSSSDVAMAAAVPPELRLIHLLEPSAAVDSSVSYCN